MSIKIMTAVWEHGPEDKSELLMLLALADHCDDEGHCYPGMARLAKKCRITERGAQKILRRLELDRWISIDTGGGRRNCNLYTIHNLNPERGSPPNVVHPEQEGAKPRTGGSETPNGGSPEPYNHQEPSGQEKIFSMIEEGLKAGKSWPVRMMPQNITDEMLRRGALTYREARLRHYPHTPERKEA